MRSQLFVLDRDMLRYMSKDEILATWEDMRALGIAQPPYPQFTIQVPFGAIVSTNEGLLDTLVDAGKLDHRDKVNWPVRVEYDTVHVKLKMMCKYVDSNKWYDWFDFLDWAKTKNSMPHIPDIDGFKADCIRVMDELGKALIVLLATKNVSVDTRKNTLAKFGVGKQQYEYVTTLKIGKLVEEHLDSEPTGMTKRPHLRRGHIRRQKYGPSLTYEKKVFIPPVFVNGWMPNARDDRGAYNVSTSRKENQ